MHQAVYDRIHTSWRDSVWEGYREGYQEGRIWAQEIAAAPSLFRLSLLPDDLMTITEDADELANRLYEEIFEYLNQTKADEFWSTMSGKAVPAWEFLIGFHRGARDVWWEYDRECPLGR